MPSDELGYAFNLIRVPATEDTNEVSRLISGNEATYEIF